MIVPNQVETVISGMGILSSIGENVSAFSESLRAGRSGISRCARKHPSVPVDIAAEIRDFSFMEALGRRDGLPEKVFRSAKRLGQRAPLPVQVAILSALEAWKMAGLFDSRPSSERIGLIIAGQNTSQNYQYGLYQTFQEDPEYLSPRYVLEFFDSNHLGVLSEMLDIHGEGLVVGGASATGNVALVKAWQAVSLGLLDVCLVAGIMADPSPMDLQGFYTMGAMGGRKFSGVPNKACRPFDTQHEGFIYGQAGACVVVESRESSDRRAVAALAHIRAGAIHLDGNSMSNPSVQGEMAAMRLALSRSGLGSSDLDYLNAHGSSSPLGDRTEAEAIRAVLGDQIDRIWINSTKGLTGHCLQSAGLVEIIATAVQMQEGFLHPNRNLEDPVDPDLRFSGPLAIETRLETAMSNSFGFGGINSSVILTRGL